MGNEISTHSGDLKESVLSTRIIKWALDDYSAGIDITTSDGSKFKQLLKKRACCTRQLKMPIAIPYVDGAQIKYVAVNIPIFSSDTAITKENCTFAPGNTTDEQLFYGDIISASTVVSNEKCGAIYRPLCDKVKRDRTSVYTSRDEQLYGPYDDQKLNPSDDKPNEINVYTDCNCENSIYHHSLDKDAELFNAVNAKNLDSNTLAQLFDPRCSLNNRVTYKTSAVSGDIDICINQADIIDSNATTKGEIDTNQQCNFTKPPPVDNQPFIPLPTLITTLSILMSVFIIVLLVYFLL